MNHATPDGDEDSRHGDAVEQPTSTQDVAAAYARLGLNDSIKGFAATKGLGGGFGSILGGAGGNRGLWPVQSPEPIIPLVPLDAGVEPRWYDLPDFGVDDSPQRTAQATEQMAQKLADMHVVTEDLVRLTAINLRHTEEQRALSARTERFTRGMTWASLAVALASLGVAVIALAK